MSDLKKNVVNSLDRAHRKINDKIKGRWPKVSLYFYTKPRAKWLYYKNERALMKGMDVSTSDHQSVVFFSVHKAATMYVNSVLSKLSQAHGLLPIDYSGWFSSANSKMYEHYNDPEFMKTAFRPKGYYYGALRQYRKIPSLERFKTVIVLRDPRDVLVSHYYSVAFSHAMINKGLMEKRKKALEQTIDEYVLDLAPEMLQTYTEHVEHVIGKENVLFLTYEEMIKDLESWLRKIVAHTGLKEHPEVVQEIVERSKFNKGTGEKKDHVRAAKAGDHAEKLKPDTIAQLNILFEPVMKYLGYPI